MKNRKRAKWHNIVSEPPGVFVNRDGLGLLGVGGGAFVKLIICYILGSAVPYIYITCIYNYNIYVNNIIVVTMHGFSLIPRRPKTPQKWHV